MLMVSGAQVAAPKLMSSPSCSRWCVTRWRFTYVPLRLFWSMIIQPSPACWISAWRRDMPGSVSTRWHSELRPINTSGWWNSTLFGSPWRT